MGQPPKQRELIVETLLESQRHENFLRIYPTKNSDFYDFFLQGNKTAAQSVYSFIFSDSFRAIEWSEIISRDEKCVEPAEEDEDKKDGYRQPEM